jgi:hypothetical protein
MKNECFPIVLDTSSKNLMGHYLQFSIDVCESYERTRKPAMIISSNQGLREWFQKKSYKFVKLHFVGFGLHANVFSELEAFLSLNSDDLSKPRHIFILRGKDLSDGNRALLKDLLFIYPQLHAEVLVNVSGVISESKEAASETRVIHDFAQLGERVRFLAWDKRVLSASRIENFRFLPEPKSQILRSKRPPRAAIGFYGKLSFERGLFDFLFSVFFNPKLHYRISGYGFNRKHLYRSRNFVSMRRTPVRGILSLALNYIVQIAFLSRRVSFEEHYFSDEIEMSNEMQSCSAIFFSCSRSPYSSGLVYQSLASGIPVVWSPGNSAMAYVLEESFPQGRIRTEDLFRWNRLFNLVGKVEDIATSPIFDHISFDETLSYCPFD